MNAADAKHGWLLLLDTCAPHGSVALFHDDALIAEQRLPEHADSIGVVVAELLGSGALTPKALECVGVVSGPGSFTGVRVGLAFAKGLCLAAEVPLVTVSRLAVLAETAAVSAGFAAVEAGRAAVYLRSASQTGPGTEAMVPLEEALGRVAGATVAVSTEELAGHFRSTAAEVRVVSLSARDARPLAWRRWQEGADELVRADANYVRDEAAIYRRSPAAGEIAPTGVSGG